MFDRLKKSLGLGRDDIPVPPTAADAQTEDGLLFGGAYRMHREEDVGHFTALAADAFPSFADRIRCFGTDWLGRQFATDSARVVDGAPQVLMLEPGTGEALQIPVGQAAFHAEELPQNKEATLAFSFFERWRAGGGAVPGYRECVGYKVPLFLGGADEVTNLELGDFDVYWSIMAQLLEKTRGLPPGTRIGRVEIGD